MNLDEILNTISGLNIVNFFFQAFAIVFSLIYILFSIVIFKQTQVMNRTVQTSSGGLIGLISLIQILLGVGLLILSIIFV